MKQSIGGKREQDRQEEERTGRIFERSRAAMERGARNRREREKERVATR